MLYSALFIPWSASLRYLYNVLIYLSIPFILIRLVWRSWQRPGYGKRWYERFGFIPSPPHEGGIWFHAVSLGETIAAVPLINALLMAQPHLSITVTAMTLTGSDRARALLGDRVHQVYVPYDIPGAVKRFLKRVKPRVAVIMETELWPNLLHYGKAQGVSLMLANGRLSQPSAQGYKRLRYLVQPMLEVFSTIAVQSSEDRDRFYALGAKAKQLVVTGNVKYHITILPELYQQAHQLRKDLGVERPVWIAASTHGGEEALILEAFHQLRERCPHALLVLVPRHPERFEKVTRLCQKQGLEVARRSQRERCTKNIAIYLGDTLGELLLMYGACDVAFVGGSFVPVGGHNVLEAAAFAKPVITGPYTHNFLAVNEQLRAVGALKPVSTVDSLAEAVIFWLNDKQAACEAGWKGQQVVKKNSGALGKHVALIEDLL